jgi:hypothetical protein
MNSWTENWRELPREDKERALLLWHEKMARLARKDPNIFMHYVLFDLPDQEPIHRAIQDHISQYKYAGVLAPRDHAKSTQTLGRVLWEIGRNPDLRIKIVKNTDPKAAEFVFAIKQHMESNGRLRRVFPHLRLEESDATGHKVTVKRKKKSPDASIEALGVTSSATGGRADLIIFDDIVDFRNAIANPAMRPMIKQVFYSVWLNLLEPWGRIVYIATVWHQDDLTHELMQNREYNFMVFRVSNDYSEIHADDGRTFPLWKWDYAEDPRFMEAGAVAALRDNPEVWGTIMLKRENGDQVKFLVKFSDKPRWVDAENLLVEKWTDRTLRARSREIGAREFDRGYRNRALSDDEAMFPESLVDSLPDRSLGPMDVPKEWPRFGGVDLAISKKDSAAYTVFFILAVRPKDGQRFPVAITREKMGSPETVTLLEELHYRHRVQMWFVENNAYQAALLEWIEYKRKKGLMSKPEPIPVKGFMTGRQKADALVGLPGMATEMANGGWTLPMGDDEHLVDCQCSRCEYMRELKTYPVGKTKDIVMASWFAREAARAGIRPSVESLKKRKPQKSMAVNTNKW